MVEVNTAPFDALVARLATLDGLTLRVGVMGPGGGATGPHPDGDGLSIAEVAAFAEYGTATSPARPIVRGYLAEGGEAELATDLAKLATEVAAGADAETNMRAIGDKHATAMRARFDRGIGPAIEVEPEGGDPRPLHDTLSVANAIRSHVERGR